MTDLRTAPLPTVLDRVERLEMLDRVAEPVEQIENKVPEGVRQGLTGVPWLGSRLHPALVHFPLGAWAAASVMDAAGRPDTARSLTVLGVATAIPAAATGLADWSGLRTGQKRIGLVHAATNSVALLLYAGSIAARCSRHVGLGQKLGLAGLIAVSAGGAIGGDLVYRRAAGVSGQS